MKRRKLWNRLLAGTMSVAMITTGLPVTLLAEETGAYGDVLVADETGYEATEEDTSYEESVPAIDAYAEPAEEDEADVLVDEETVEDGAELVDGLQAGEDMSAAEESDTLWEEPSAVDDAWAENGAEELIEENDENEPAAQEHLADNDRRAGSSFADARALISLKYWGGGNRFWENGYIDAEETGYFSVVPDRSIDYFVTAQVYTYDSDGNGEGHGATDVTVYDSDGNVMTGKMEDSDTTYYSMTAGKTYYLSVNNELPGEVSVDVYLYPQELYAGISTEDDQSEYLIGRTMTIVAEPELPEGYDTVSYRWSKWEGDSEDEKTALAENSARLTDTLDTVGKITYEAEITARDSSAADNSRILYSIRTITIEVGRFMLRYPGDISRTMIVGYPEELTVTMENPSNIAYKTDWYVYTGEYTWSSDRDDWVKLDQEDQLSYMVTPEEAGELIYICEVTAADDSEKHALAYYVTVEQANDSFDNAVQMDADEESGYGTYYSGYVHIPKDGAAMLTFTPDRSIAYRMQAYLEKTGEDSSWTLYGSDQQIVAEGTGGDMNALIELTAGQTYYLKVANPLDESTEAVVDVSPQGYELYASSDSTTELIGKERTIDLYISGSAPADADRISIQWSRENSDGSTVMLKKHSASLTGHYFDDPIDTITDIPDVPGEVVYIAEVTAYDDDAEDSTRFWYGKSRSELFAGQLAARPEGESDRTVIIGNTETLRVALENPSDLDYRSVWYCYGGNDYDNWINNRDDWEQLEDTENELRLSVSPQEQGTKAYICLVSMPDGSEEQLVDFYVTGEIAHDTAETALPMSVFDDIYANGGMYFEYNDRIPAGSTVMLSFTPDRSISYGLRSGGKVDAALLDGEQVLWENQTEKDDESMVLLTAGKTYYIRLTNSFISKEYAYIKVVPDSISVRLEADKAKVLAGERVTFTASLDEIPEGYQDLSYVWSRVVYDEETEDDIETILEGETGSTLTVVPEETGYPEYHVCVTAYDQKHDQKTRLIGSEYFGLAVRDIIVDAADGITSVPGLVGDTVTLSVDVRAAQNAPEYQFSWVELREDGYGVLNIPMELYTKTISVPLLNEGYYNYQCRVETLDGENIDSVTFYVSAHAADSTHDTLEKAAEVKVEYQEYSAVFEGNKSIFVPADSTAYIKIVDDLPAGRYSLKIYAANEVLKSELLDHAGNVLTGSASSNTWMDDLIWREDEQYYLRVKNGSANNDLSINLIPQEHIHSYDFSDDSGVVTKAATCGAEGVRTYTCTECGSTMTGSIPKLADHSYGSWSVTKAASVTQTGIETRKCSVCGAKQTRTIAKLPAEFTINASGTQPMKTGQTVKNKITVTSLSKGLKVTWQSSNDKVVKVTGSDSGCTLKAVKAGKADITATAGGITRKFTVKVTKKQTKTKRVSVDQKKLTLKKGSSYTLNAIVSPLTTADKLSFSTSNKKVATVSRKGVIKAKKAGKAVITVKSGKKKVKVTVVVQ